MMSALRQGSACSEATAVGEAYSGSQNRTSSLSFVFLEGRNGKFRTDFFGESAKSGGGGGQVWNIKCTPDYGQNQSSFFV